MDGAELREASIECRVEVGVGCVAVYGWGVVSVCNRSNCVIEFIQSSLEPLARV